MKTDPTHQTGDGSAPLDNRSWEIFCGAATGWSGGDPVTATDAYLAAFPKTQSRQAARANAARLAARPDVASRCAWMRAQLANSCLMDAAAVRATIVGLRLEVINKTRNTSNKKLALEAARDLDRMGYANLGQPDVSKTVSPEAEATAAVMANIRKMLDKQTGAQP